ncbi:hypothetical protein BASA62_008768 [Batrachochytrium salamandrivorans]|nr:hypothetical protein BASA62_008768 [Batrachochytrium salamandrivorans]
MDDSVNIPSGFKTTDGAMGVGWRSDLRARLGVVTEISLCGMVVDHGHDGVHSECSDERDCHFQSLSGAIIGSTHALFACHTMRSRAWCKADGGVPSVSDMMMAMCLTQHNVFDQQTAPCLWDTIMQWDTVIQWDTIMQWDMAERSSLRTRPETLRLEAPVTTTRQAHSPFSAHSVSLHCPVEPTSSLQKICSTTLTALPLWLETDPLVHASTHSTLLLLLDGDYTKSTIRDEYRLVPGLPDIPSTLDTPMSSEINGCGRDPKTSYLEQIVTQREQKWQCMDNNVPMSGCGSGATRDKPADNGLYNGLGLKLNDVLCNEMLDGLLSSPISAEADGLDMIVPQSICHTLFDTRIGDSESIAFPGYIMPFRQESGMVQDGPVLSVIEDTIFTRVREWVPTSNHIYPLQQGIFKDLIPLLSSVKGPGKPAKHITESPHYEEFNSDISIQSDLLSCVSSFPNTFFQEVRLAPFDQPSTHRLPDPLHMPSPCSRHTQIPGVDLVQHAIEVMSLVSFENLGATQLRTLPWNLINALMSINDICKLTLHCPNSSKLAIKGWRKEVQNAVVPMDVFETSRRIIQRLQTQFEPIADTDPSWFVLDRIPALISYSSEALAVCFQRPNLPCEHISRKRGLAIQTSRSNEGEGCYPPKRHARESSILFSASTSVDDFIRLRGKSVLDPIILPTTTTDLPILGHDMSNQTTPKRQTESPMQDDPSGDLDPSFSSYMPESDHVYLATPVVFRNTALVRCLASRYRVELYERSYGMCSPSLNDSVHAIAVDERRCIILFPFQMLSQHHRLWAGDANQEFSSSEALFQSVIGELLLGVALRFTQIKLILTISCGHAGVELGNQAVVGMGENSLDDSPLWVEHPGGDRGDRGVTWVGNNGAFVMTTPPVQSVLAHLCQFSLTLFDRLGTSLEWVMSNTSDHAAGLIRRFGDEMADQMDMDVNSLQRLYSHLRSKCAQPINRPWSSRYMWENRGWLHPDQTPHNVFLCMFPTLNAMNVAIVLAQTSLNEFAMLDNDQVADAFGLWIEEQRLRVFLDYFS